MNALHLHVAVEINVNLEYARHLFENAGETSECRIVEVDTFYHESEVKLIFSVESKHSRD